MPEYVLVAETGSDIHQDTAERHGITVVPMHVNMEGASLDDDSFPTEELFESYRRTGTLPKTSACSPQDFVDAFDRIHAERPHAHIVYLAYSAVTTASFKSGTIAAEDRDYVTCIDTRFVSAAQRLIVTNTARMIEARPTVTLPEIEGFVADQSARCRFVFIPGDLDYLRAGGRLSNVGYLGAQLLRIRPTVEVINGKLVATKKRRGSMLRCIQRTVEDVVTREAMDLSRVTFTYTSGAAPDPLVRALTERIVVAHGAQEIEWVKSGCVIAAHSGPGSFAISALAAS